jgi:hypothetical protein
MFFQTKSHLIHWGIAAVVMATAIGGFAQKTETIQAQAFGTTTRAGQSFGITIIIEEYSTPADRQALIDAFKSGGHDQMVKVLSKMKAKGRVRLSSGGVGYQIAYIRNVPTPNGRKLRILTDRPINIGEAMASTRSLDYDLSVIDLDLTNDKKKSTGSLIPGCRVTLNKKKQIEVESYNATPWRLAGIMER